MATPELKRVLNRLAGNGFRSRFRLGDQECEYISKKGIESLESHARDFIRTRLAPCNPKNDGKQTPFRGHPVFVAQHATATCCRSCLQKWHSIPMNQELDAPQLEFIVSLIVGWLGNQIESRSQAQPAKPSQSKQKTLF